MKYLIFVLSIILTGCIVPGRYGYYDANYPIYNMPRYETNFGHQFRRNNLIRDLHRQQDELEEIRLRREMNYNNRRINEERYNINNFN